MVDLLLGYLRKSLDEFSMTGTPGSDCAAAAAIGGSPRMTTNAMPATMYRLRNAKQRDRGEEAQLALSYRVGNVASFWTQ